jgi:hypothetical protein
MLFSSNLANILVTSMAGSADLRQRPEHVAAHSREALPEHTPEH